MNAKDNFSLILFTCKTKIHTEHCVYVFASQQKTNSKPSIRYIYFYAVMYVRSLSLSCWWARDDAKNQLGKSVCECEKAHTRKFCCCCGCGCGGDVVVVAGGGAAANVQTCVCRANVSVCVWFSANGQNRCCCCCCI